MKKFVPFSLILAIALCSLIPAARATNTGKKAAPAAKTNAPPEELPIPLSVFDVTQTPTKDPFFPNSLRQPVPKSVTSTPLAFNAQSFALKGLSGEAGHPLALVNNRTVAPGEDAEVTTAAGKVKIHCVAIKSESVVIRVPTQLEPIEIFLRKAAQ